MNPDVLDPTCVRGCGSELGCGRGVLAAGDLASRRRCGGGGGGAGAFTLFEVLVVVALLSIVATIGVPAIYHTVKRSPLRQSMADVVEACQNARMLAILQGATTEVVIRAGDGLVQVHIGGDPVGGGSPGDAGEAPAQEPAFSDGSELGSEASTRSSGRSELIPFTARIPDGVAFKRLVVNLQDRMDEDEARVRFYPNGTCDAFEAALLSEQNEERSITLEITTGREDVEVIR